MNNNLDINLNPTVSLNSIKYNSSRHRESFPYELCKVQPKMLQRDEVEMAVMMVLVVEVMVMMILMKFSTMAVMTASISPSGREFPPADSCLPESFSLSGVLRPVAAAEYFCEPSLHLRFP